MKLKELAGHLGLSQTTVSRALNDYPEVKETTRLRVKETAKRLGYSANASALRLATGRSGTIGLVIGGDSTQQFGPHASEYLTGVAGRLARDEIDILVSPVDSDDEIPAFKRLIASKRVDALILGAPAPYDERVKLLTKIGFPFILHGRTEIGEVHPWLDIDNRGAFHRATLHLLDLGHRRIGMINGPAGQTFAEHREIGYRSALLERGVAPDRRLIANGRFTDEVGFRWAQSFLELSPRPTAFLAGSMMTALGVFRAIRLAGLTLGKDISMIAHDDVFPYLNADNMVPSMSTTRSSIRAAGSRVAELVLQVLAGKPADEIHELWPVELVLRESTGPAPKD